MGNELYVKINYGLRHHRHDPFAYILGLDPKKGETNKSYEILKSLPDNMLAYYPLHQILEDDDSSLFPGVIDEEFFIDSGSNYSRWIRTLMPFLEPRPKCSKVFWDYVFKNNDKKEIERYVKELIDPKKTVFCHVLDFFKSCDEHCVDIYKLDFGGNDML